MKSTFLFSACLGIAASASLTSSSFAQVLFSDDFDSGLSGGNWASNLSGGDGSADFAFDYSTLGIPAAPNSNGTTIGAGFLINQFSGVFAGISASPFDQHFTGDFRIEFDLWINFVGPFPAGGSGSTQMASYGWGTSGSTTQWAGATNAILLASSGDGGTGTDYRVYGAAGGAPLAPSTGVYAAGTAADAQNNTNAYYSGFGGVAAPAAQLALYPNQSGATGTGTLGMSWHEITIEKSGDTLRWNVDDTPFATVPLGGFTLGGDNLTIGMFDINAGSSTDPNNFLNTAIYDNILVTVPEPSAAAMLGLFACAALLRRRRPIEGRR